MLGAMQDSKLEPNAFSWSAAIAACERAGEWEKALALFAGLRAEGGAADSVVYHAAISAAASGGDVQLARRLLEEMQGEADPEVAKASLRAYNGVLKACERSADWDAAFDVLSSMKGEGVMPDRVSYTLAVGAAGRAGEWEQALGLWTQMETEGVTIDATALRTLLRALTVAGQWAISLQIFAKILESDLEEARTPSVFAAALDACARGAQPERACALLQHMAELRIPPNAACYHAVAEACASTGDWRGSLSALQDMLRQDMQPAVETWGVVYEACRDAGQNEEAAAVQNWASHEGISNLVDVRET